MKDARLVPFERNRLAYVCFVFLVLGAGLLWRSNTLPLPPFAAKYGGDALWALLVFFGLGTLINRASTQRVTLVSLAFAWSIEFSQLYHAPWIDSIRAIRLGNLVLGSTFNPPDLLAYLCGIAGGAVLEYLWARSNERS